MGIIDTLRGTPSSVAKILAKSDDDVVVTLAVRSPMCKAKKGGFKDMQPDELLTSFYKSLVPAMKINPALVEDIAVGNCNCPDPVYTVRAAALVAGFPNTTSTQIVNRFCSSGLMAVSVISNQIRNGEIEIGLAVGFESMSAGNDRAPTKFSDDFKTHPEASDAGQVMGWTSENVSKDFNISRQRMDHFAAQSHQRAGRAQAEGLFDSEILPVMALQLPKTPAPGGTTPPARIPVLVSRDDGIRADSTAEGLSKIRAAFPQWGNGTTTGGNASQLTDGVAAVLLMTRRKAKELGLTILGRHVQTVVAGLPPRIMGVGPTVAIPKLLKNLNITKDDVDLWEVNEAFASMYAVCIDQFGLPEDRCNVNGGGIALGHPLGCTGARQVATGLAELKRRGGKILVTSMCIGSGMGAAALWVNE